MTSTLADAARQVRASLSDGICAVEMVSASTRNALSDKFVEQLRECLDAARDSDAKVVVLLGLEDVFCSGAPAETLRRLARGEVEPAEIVLTKAMLDVQIPTISAMEGHATGGGLALGFAADIIILARESRYGASFMNMGFTPGMGMTYLFEHALSTAVAHELLFTGEYRRGADLVDRGGVNYILPKKQVRARAFDVAARIAEKPKRALEVLKRTLSIPRRRAFEESRTVEALMHAVTFSLPETIERIEDEYVK